jgi:peptidoglycan/xylan/chitin deacetylase (PgdA/CDA1 family)
MKTVSLARVRRGLADRITRNWAPGARLSRALRPLATFTFDDFPKSALVNGGRLLRENGARGTFFVCGDLEGKILDGVRCFDRGDLIRARDEGHEIGCHTFEHLRLPFASDRDVLGSLRANEAYLRAVAPGVRMESFAYPYGHVNVSRKALLAKRFSACRGIWPGINADKVDFAQLKAVPLELNSIGRIDIRALVDEAVARAGWLVFFTHDVSEAPSPFGYPTSELARVIQTVRQRGVAILPLREAAAEVREGFSAQAA